MARWQPSRGRDLLARVAYPVFWLLNRPSMAWFGRAAYDFALRCNGIAINFRGRHGLSAAEEAFLARIAPEIGEGTALDVGANTGAYAIALRRLAPQARILAFEPHPATRATLEDRLAGAGVEIHAAALGDTVGEASLFDFASADGSTQASLSRDSVALYESEVVEHPVVATTLDHFLDAQGIGDVAFLKVDTEGHDLHVLRGARESIARRRFRVIQFEFIGANIATGVTMRDFFDALPGYRISRLCLNGGEMPLDPYSVKRCEIFVNHNLIARPI
ncbi:FkbM family methyltransferase [Sabulicella rubraurantiaca]|uniref:FkbM family methyltransferase n=1 Tax=Sabulicella rubraurantiaca TaxID=2811429 RepID=UPI001A959E6F|nr:FkbM family methyltransferase [Sabulicella rubraurantiaca]